LIARQIPEEPLPRCHVTFIWIESNKRRDPDNVAFAKKFILDAAQKAGLIENDGHKQIAGFTDRFEFGGQCGVVVEFEPVECGDER